jgi:tRNA(Ile)-lysidine synthase
VWPDGGKLGLAVSGGPDSLAMLLLAEAAIPGRFEVATVDHGLRPEAADECAMVAEVCADRGVPCEVLKVAVGEGNVQSNARHRRYWELLHWAARRELSAVATAHQADDQTETLLMRLNRGSGVKGLAGVREKQSFLWSSIPVIRPLLRLRRHELAEVVEAARLEPARDPSNDDERYDRVRIRKALEQNDWLDPIAITQSALNLEDADRALGMLMTKEWSEVATVTEKDIRFRPRWPREITLRMVAFAISGCGGSPRGQDAARLMERLYRGEGGNVAGVLATVEGDEWVFRPEPPRRTG